MILGNCGPGNLRGTLWRMPLAFPALPSMSSSLLCRLASLARASSHWLKRSVSSSCDIYLFSCQSNQFLMNSYSVDAGWSAGRDTYMQLPTTSYSQFVKGHKVRPAKSAITLRHRTLAPGQLSWLETNIWLLKEASCGDRGQQYFSQKGNFL